MPEDAVDAEEEQHEEGLSVSELELAATNTPVHTHTAYALAVAVDEGSMTEVEARKALEFRQNAGQLEWIKSEHYPGDEAYDKADIRYGGLYS